MDKKKTNINFALASAASALGKDGKVFKEKSPLPPPLEKTLSPSLITWPTIED